MGFIRYVENHTFKKIEKDLITPIDKGMHWVCIISNKVTLPNSFEKVLSYEYYGRYRKGNINNNQKESSANQWCFGLSVVIFRRTNSERDEYFINVFSKPVL